MFFLHLCAFILYFVTLQTSRCFFSRTTRRRISNVDKNKRKHTILKEKRLQIINISLKYQLQNISLYYYYLFTSLLFVCRALPVIDTWVWFVYINHLFDVECGWQRVSLCCHFFCWPFVHSYCVLILFIKYRKTILLQYGLSLRKRDTVYSQA